MALKQCQISLLIQEPLYLGLCTIKVKWERTAVFSPSCAEFNSDNYSWLPGPGLSHPAAGGGNQLQTEPLLEAPAASPKPYISKDTRCWCVLLPLVWDEKSFFLSLSPSPLFLSVSPVPNADGKKGLETKGGLPFSYCQRFKLNETHLVRSPIHDERANTAISYTNLRTSTTENIDKKAVPFLFVPLIRPKKCALANESKWQPWLSTWFLIRLGFESSLLHFECEKPAAVAAAVAATAGRYFRCGRVRLKGCCSVEECCLSFQKKIFSPPPDRP